MTDRNGKSNGCTRRLLERQPGKGRDILSAKEKRNTAARLILERSLASLEASGDITLSTSRSRVAGMLAEALADADLFQWKGETAIALELISNRWQPVGTNLAEAAVHGVQLGGILQAGGVDDVVDYLRVVEAQHRGGPPRPTQEYRALARRLESAYREVSPNPKMSPSRSSLPPSAGA